MNIIKSINNVIYNRFINEMAGNKNKTISTIQKHSESLIEHFIKMFLFGNSTNNLNDWSDTVANILDFCNTSKVKTSRGKLKYNTYLEELFGINNTFDFGDARGFLYDFYIKHKNDFLNFTFNPMKDIDMVKRFYNSYKEFATYFANIMATDKVGGSRLNEFKYKSIEFATDDRLQ